MWAGEVDEEVVLELQGNEGEEEKLEDSFDLRSVSRGCSETERAAESSDELAVAFVEFWSE
jgi:hypothetical protein